MSSENWTPGPWSIIESTIPEDDDSPPPHIGDSNNMGICAVHSRGGPYPDVVREEMGNAHLIVASPDMADALRQWQHAEETGDPRELQNARHSRDAALAKARGESHE